MDGDIKQRIREAADKNKVLLAIVAETQHGAPDLEQHVRLVGDLEFQVSESDARARELEARRKKELKDHESYQNSAVRRFMFRITGKSGSFDARAAKEEREYFDVLSAELRENKANRALRSQLARARAELHGLGDVVEQNRTAQAELDSLYNSIFAGPSGPSFPEEDQREREANEAQRAYHDTRSKLECEQHVVRLLASSLDQMDSARAHLDSALGRSRADIFASAPASTLHDMMERSALQNATSAIASAQNFAAQAARFSHFVSALAHPTVSVSPGNVMADVLFDNISTDMMFHQQIQRARGDVDRMSGDVASELDAARQRLALLQGDLAARERTLASTKKALQEVRADAFRRVVEEASVGGLQIRLAQPRTIGN